MVAFAKSTVVTTTHKARDPEAPFDDRTRLLSVGDDDSHRGIPEAKDLDLMVIEPPQEWLDEDCGY